MKIKKIKIEYITAFGALVLWTAWTWYVNADHPIGTRILSSLVQGIWSFFVTFYMLVCLKKIFNYFENKWLKIILPTLITVSIVFVMILGIHILIGTPELWATITPGIIGGVVLNIIATIKLFNKK